MKGRAYTLPQAGPRLGLTDARPPRARIPAIIALGIALGNVDSRMLAIESPRNDLWGVWTEDAPRL